MKRVEDFIKNIDEQLDEKSNKLSDVIAKLQEIEKEYGGDIEVIASTQDGAVCDVIPADISVQDWTKPGNTKVKRVCIE